MPGRRSRRIVRAAEKLRARTSKPTEPPKRGIGVGSPRCDTSGVGAERLPATKPRCYGMAGDCSRIEALEDAAEVQKQRFHLVADLELAAVILHEMTHLLTWRLGELYAMSSEDWFRLRVRLRYGLGPEDGCNWGAITVVPPAPPVQRDPGPTGLYTAVPTSLQGLPLPAARPWL